MIINKQVIYNIVTIGIIIFSYEEKIIYVALIMLSYIFKFLFFGTILVKLLVNFLKTFLYEIFAIIFKS